MLESVLTTLAAGGLEAAASSSCSPVVFMGSLQQRAPVFISTKRTLIVYLVLKLAENDRVKLDALILSGIDSTRCEFGPYLHDRVTQLLQICWLNIHDTHDASEDGDHLPRK